MKQKTIQGFIIEGEDNFWSLDDKLDDINNYFVSLKFYSFMNSNYESRDTTYLDQIVYITGIDLTPLDEMARYIPSWEAEEKYEMLDSELFPIYLKNVEQENQKIKGNIDRVIDCLNRIIPELEKKKDLFHQLKTDDSISKDYLRNMDNIDCRDHITNNLAQDLRNILRYSLLAKSQGIETTFFFYRQKFV